MADRKNKKMYNIMLSLLVGVAIGLVSIFIIPEGRFLDAIREVNIVVFFTSMVIWILPGVVIHELGHLVCGWASGYRLGSFKLGSLSWFTEDNKVKFRRSKNFAPGQCLMIPPNNEADFKYLLYNLGGNLFNFLLGMVMLLLWYVLPSGQLLGHFIFAGLTMNLLLGLMNLIPIRSEGNDGANIIEALKSGDGKRAFYLNLYINGQLMQGKQIKEIEEETIRVYGKMDPKNYHVGSVVLFEIDYLLANDQADEALAIAQQINTDKFPTLYRNSFKLAQLFIYICYLPDFDRARAIYKDQDFQVFLKMKLPNMIIATLAYEFFVNNNYEKAEKLLVQAKKDTANIPNKGARLGLMDFLEQLEEKMVRE